MSGAGVVCYGGRSRRFAAVDGGARSQAAVPIEPDAIGWLAANWREVVFVLQPEDGPQLCSKRSGRLIAPLLSRLACEVLSFK